MNSCLSVYVGTYTDRSTMYVYTYIYIQGISKFHNTILGSTCPPTETKQKSSYEDVSQINLLLRY